MGVFKWLRRERVTVTTRHNVTPDDTTPDVHQSQSATEIPIGAQIGTIRTEEYKRDLAEFQARRSTGSKDPEDLEILKIRSPSAKHQETRQAKRTEGRELEVTPVKKKCGRQSLPLSCTDCATDHDNTFNYEKKSASKYKKHKRARSNTPEKIYEGVPNIQFLFQNQVFMPGGNMFTTSTFTEPHKPRRHSRRSVRSPDFLLQKNIDFNENDAAASPPEFFKNNSLSFDVKAFLDGSRSEEEVDGVNAAGDVTSHSNKGFSASENKDHNGDDNLREVMSELKHLDEWADEQLLTKSPSASKSDDSRSECSAYGLPIASARNLDVDSDLQKTWVPGRWGVAPVQIKKLGGVTVEHVRKKRNTEINILRKCRHPNIILLMGLYPDTSNNVHIICERCVDSLFGVLHVQGRILSAQTAVQYTLDIANAMMFLLMQGYIHTELNSMAIMITSHDTAKLADLGPCVKVRKDDKRLKGIDKGYEIYSPEPQYVNIEGCEGKSSDNEPLLSADPSETYLKSNAVAKPYEHFQNEELYRWQAPELFTPGEDGMVYPCAKSDVYSLCLILWEGCNASIPWKQLTYEALKEHYTLWQTGLPLPQDGTYPGSLLSLLQSGLRLDRSTRMDLEKLQQTLQAVKCNLDGLGYIIIPARLSTKKSNFSSVAWDTTSPTDSDCQSPKNLQHEAVVHNTKNTPSKQSESTSDSSEKDNSKSDNPVYESIKKTYSTTYAFAQKCFIDDDDDERDNISLSKYQLVPEKDFSSACSTPISKVKARIKIDTPGTLHRSDSTEYCSILSPNRTANFAPNDDSHKDQSVERPTAKLSRSFTPKSYKPLHIKVPEYNLDSIKPLLREQNATERPSYNFDIKNYSLPSTPIARSNKLRKNAWLSGDVTANVRCSDTKLQAERKKSLQKTPSKEDCSPVLPEIRPPESPETIPKSTSCSPEIRASSDNNTASRDGSLELTPESVDTVKISLTELKRATIGAREGNEYEARRTWCQGAGSKVVDPLAGVNVKPLVAIHERWIYEAGRKAARSMSLPEDNSFRAQISAVKPASHCVDTMQQSLPQLNSKIPTKRTPTSTLTGGNWEQFCQARDNIAKGLDFSAGSPDRFDTWTKNSDKGIAAEERIESKTDQYTDTNGIEDFIRDLIRKEFQHLIHELADDTSTISQRNEDFLKKGVSNIVESLTSNDDAERTLKREPVKSFSRVKINGNNKPLLQITFSRTGENSLQVLDNCVNVTICDNPKEKLNVSLEDTVTEDLHIGGLKRCQAFNAIQEARSTEDLYIDDELSTQVQENFGGRVKLIPLHGSLHEILCEREDECCLVKVKQENGCDTIYFRCDNSDTESKDAIDGCEMSQDTVVYKRSISLIEERIQRVVPKDKRAPTPVMLRKNNVKTRPKSEIFAPIKRETRVLSSSSPSLITNDRDEVEVNIESVMSYQDSSSEECLHCQTDNEEFEMLERKIEENLIEDMASNMQTLGCGCLGKISEENLSSLNEDAEKE